MFMRFDKNTKIITLEFKDDQKYVATKLTKIFSRITFRSPVANLRSDFNGLDLYTVK